MVYYRVVSTKLTEEEHDMLLDLCNIMGCPPSTLIRQAIKNAINSQQKFIQKTHRIHTSVNELIFKPQLAKKKPFENELEKLLGIRQVL